MDLNYLQHHGVKGMKWGVRRYQYKDGSLTPAGVKRYAKSDYADKKDAKKVYKDAVNKAFSQYEKNINDIEKKYKRGQNLTDEDVARERKVEENYQKAVKKAKEEYKQAKTQRTKNAVKQYKKSTDEFYKLDEIASAKWTEAEAQYAALGKNRVQRMMAVVNTQKGKTDVAKNYLSKFDEAEAASNLADTKWREVNELYRNTGKNRISRVMNNFKYRNG